MRMLICDSYHSQPRGGCARFVKLLVGLSFAGVFSTPFAVAASSERNGAASSVASQAEILLLELVVNGQRHSDVVRAENLPGGILLLPVDAWTQMRLLPLPRATALSDGTPAYAINELPETTYKLDRPSLTLKINAGASAFIPSTLAMSQGSSELPPRPQPGVMLNYDMALSRATSSSSGGVFMEAVAFNGFGDFVTSALASRDGSEHRTTRLDTFWRYDLPHRMETLVVGDTMGVSGGWSRPARYAGIRWGRDFAMRPGFVTLPQLSVAGSAALPSTVEVMVNNARQLSQPVQPGPFDLTNVPVLTGAGELNLVVRDLLGRETVVRQSYYMPARLLTPGLTDFSLEAGWLRTGYGRSNTYGDGFGAATWRQGLTKTLTGEGRLELQGGRRAAGVELSGALGSWGAGRVALAGAIGDRQGFDENGHLLQFGLERRTSSGGGSLQYEYASRGFAPFGEGLGSTAIAQRPRERWLFALSGRIWSYGTGGVSYVRQTRWDGDRVSSVGLFLSAPLWGRSNLILSLDKRLDGDRGVHAGVSISVPLDSGVYSSAQVQRYPTGQFAGSIAAARNPPAGRGLGWRVQAATTATQRAQGNLHYFADQAELTLDAATDDRGQMAARAGARGTVGRVGGMGFATRPVGESSVAVVQVGDLAGVPVKRANQVVAVTNSRGRAFVPGLLPWHQNAIAIDVEDLPLDVEVPNVTRKVIPYTRTAVVVDFEARRSRQALLILRQADGSDVPAGAKVRLLPAGPEFMVGRRGEAWLTDLAETTQRVQVHWPEGACMLNFQVPASPNGMPGKIGPLTCEGVSP